jgi:hypothetical protein
MRKEKRTELVTLRLRPSTKAGLQAVAEQERRPLASLLAIILEDWYEAKRARVTKRAKD